MHRSMILIISKSRKWWRRNKQYRFYHTTRLKRPGLFLSVAAGLQSFEEKRQSIELGRLIEFAPVMFAIDYSEQQLQSFFSNEY